MWVDQLALADADTAGPKIAKLGDLGAAGVTVPAGFAVTTAAYWEVIGQSSVAGRIDEMLADVAGTGQPELRELAAAAREVVRHTELPTSLVDAIGEAYDSLCSRCGSERLPTAVRSSAIGEDAADTSFAGQFDSYLGVIGTANIVEAVRSCWASLFTERAVTYRAAKGISHDNCPMAVGVFELIDARSSGVAFSVHPVTGRADRIVIEGSWGWGEAIVQGLVTPDRVEVGKSDGRILDYVVSDKAVMSTLDRSAGRVHEVEVPSELRSARALSDEEVLAISGAVGLIEEHFGHPVDVEWVASPTENDDARITVVQARPETIHGPDGVASRPEWNPAGYAMKYAFGDKTK